ncbi:F-box protein At5g39250 [Silene latifolia]|uniref:F-box protein At5g39250 n=1 Tax=Silene latifolia TaxID=37657 RepID=UPI003D77AFF1
MTCEVLKAVFPLLDGVDLASCMLVSKPWREIARDDYLWKCACARKWPSICKKPSSSSISYYKLYRTFYKRQRCRDLPPPRLSFNDLEFYIDIWLEGQLIFSEVIPGPVFLIGIKDPPSGIPDILRLHLKRPDYKMMLPVQPMICLPLGQLASISMMASRKDSDQFACIINKAFFDYVDRTSYRAHASDYLDFSPAHPFISGIRAWISLLLSDHGSDGSVEVFGIEMDFCDVAGTKEEVLWLLDMLDWK